MCLLNCARVKDHLHDSENWLRSPSDGIRWTNPPLRRFVSVIDDVKLLWTTTILSDKLDISNSLRPSKSTGQTRLDILRDVIVEIFPHATRPVSRVLQIKTKIS